LFSVAEALRASAAETERGNEVERSRLEMMRRHAEHTAAAARSCSGTSARAIAVRADAATTTGTPCPRQARTALRARQPCRERPLGRRTVQRYDGDQLTVLFDDHGYRDLLVPLVLERRLLRAV
jgi:ATP-dependent DNA helicase RecQ